MTANYNADTTDTTVPDGTPDSVSGTVADAPAEPRKGINPVFYIALGVACLAIGQDFIEEGIRAAGGRIALGPLVTPHARIDR